MGAERTTKAEVDADARATRTVEGPVRTTSTTVVEDPSFDMTEEQRLKNSRRLLEEGAKDRDPALQASLEAAQKQAEETYEAEQKAEQRFTTSIKGG